MSKQTEILDVPIKPVHMMRPSVVIVGAGLAGLSAARVLSDQGLSVTVFDRGRFPGGRLGSFGAPDALEGLEKGPTTFKAWSPKFIQACEQWLKIGLLKKSHSGESYRFASTSRNFMKALSADIKLISSSEVSSLKRSAGGYEFLINSSDPARAELPPEKSQIFSSVLIAAPPLQVGRLIDSSSSDCFSNQLAVPIGQTAYAPRWVLRVSWSDAEQLREVRIPASTALSQQWLPMSRAEVAKKATAILQEQPVDHEFSAFYDLLPLEPERLEVQAHRWSIATPTSLLSGGYMKSPQQNLYFCGDYFNSAAFDTEVSLEAEDDSPVRRPISADSGIYQGVERAWLSGFYSAQGLLNSTRADGP